MYVIHSRTDVLYLFVFTEIARIISSRISPYFYRRTRQGKAIYSLYVKVLVFRCNLTCFQAFPPVESIKLAMVKIIVKWTEGRSKGALFLLGSFERSLRCLSRSFSIVAHDIRLLVFAIFNPNPQKIHVSLRGRSASYCTTICGCLHRTTTEFLGKVKFFRVMYRS